MAGTLRAAVAASQPPPPPSPLPPSRGATASGGIPWLLRKRASKARHDPPLGGQEPDAHDEVEVELDDEGATFVVSTPCAADAAGAGGGTPERSGKRREALARLRSAVLAVVARARRRRGRRPMGSSVTGTIFGRRRGRVHLALQTDPRAPPALMVELAAYSTGALVREMSSGLVRLALECEKPPLNAGTYACQPQREQLERQSYGLTRRHVQGRSGGRCWRSRRGARTATGSSAATRCTASAAPTSGACWAPWSRCPSAQACSRTTVPPVPAREI